MLRRVSMSRRHFLGGALATTAGLALAGCGGGDDEEGKKTAQTTGQATGAAGGEPKRGGTIRTSSTVSILGLDPNTIEGVSYAPYFYSYVVHPTDWHQPDLTIGDLATSWETPTGTEWVFHIRSDAVFQNVPPANGWPLLSEDIVKSIDRYKSMPGANTIWTQWVEGYEAPDPGTFVIVTKEPYGYLLGNLGSQMMAVFPMEAVEEFGDLKSHIIGSGPFTLKSYVREEGLEAVRNPDYYHEYPYVDGHSIKVIKDEASVQAAFRAGSLDAYMVLDRIKADDVKDISGVSITKFLDRPYSVFVLNALKNPAFKDQRVREAIDLSLDRQAMIDKLHFGDGELAGPVPPLWPAALPKEEIEEAYKRDVAKARQLLAAAGYENLEFNLDFGITTDYADRASIIKDNLAEAGITVNLKGAELGTWVAGLTGSNFESTSYTHLRYGGDFIQINSHHSRGWTRDESGYLGVDDPEMDAMLDRIIGTVDTEERIKLEQDAQRLILKRHGPTFTLYEPYGYWAAYDYIKGYTPTAYGFGMYKYDYWIDKG